MKYKYYNPNIIVDQENLYDKLNYIRNKKPNDLVVGAVRMFLDGEIIEDVKPNLVVALGRQYVAQRIFGIAHPSETEIPSSTNPNTVAIWNWKVTHFGLGSGGSVVVGSYVNLLGPETCDQDLYEPLPLVGNPGDASYLTSPGDSYKGVSATKYVAKPIEPSGTIDLTAASDITCSYGPTYSYARVVCTKFPGEPNYLDSDDDYVTISEAALYYSNSSTKVRMFSHICFAPKFIEKKSEYVVEWYILC